MATDATIVVAPGWESFLQTHGLNSLDAVYRHPGGEPITRSGSTEVRRFAVRDGDAVRTIFIKKYWSNSARQLRSGMLRGTLFGRSKAHREFLNLARLRTWGLDAPAPVAYGEQRRFRFLIRSFLISEGVPNPCGLDTLIRDVMSEESPGAPPALRRELIDRLARYVRRLHEYHFVHHDLFWRNIILSGQSLDHFNLIDAHKGRVWLPGTETLARAKDLATLDAAAPAFFRRTERLRFLLLYLGQDRLDARGRQLAGRILRTAAPLRAKQLRRVREGRLIQA